MTAADPILRLEGVSKRFGGLSVIEDFSFSVRRGTRTALIGPNGAGKTTVFNIISGVYAVDAGRILLDGADITGIPSRRRIGYGIARSFQNIRLMPHLSTLENVLVGQHCRNKGIVGVLQPVSLMPRNRWREEARAALADAGLEGYERSTVGSLPYGVQKRIELVRALMARPRLLLLDEPAAGLNAAETEALQGQLERVCAGAAVTLMVVEHDMHFIGELCEHVIVLDFGRKIAEGTPDEIRQNPVVQETYLGAPIAEPRERHGATRSACPRRALWTRSRGARHLARSRRRRGRRRAWRQWRRQIVAAARVAGIGKARRWKHDLRRPRYHPLADQPARARRSRARPRGPPHRDESHRAGEPADGSLQPGRQPGRRRRDRRPL
jgi:branched-chain amino acid transport system ATP-binding protein